MGEDLFYAVLVGASLGFLFDFFRLPRLVFNDRFFFDFLFWIISGVVVFCYYLIFNSGSIRIINFILIFIGFLLYTFTLGYVTKSIEIKLAKKIKFWLKKVKNRIKSFKKVLQSLYNIYYNIVARVKNAFHKKGKGDGYDEGSDNENDNKNKKEDFF
ncbi:MAG: spore cortex biosynthesis protein YabQ [Eubacterium sp.]|nr:spore cortex biosynthesis protein YabQ [Eubacterium sp.]